MFRHQDTAQVRIGYGSDAEQIENFAFVPIGPAPDAVDGIDFRVLAADLAFQAQAFVALERMQMIDNFKRGSAGYRSTAVTVLRRMNASASP